MFIVVATVSEVDGTTISDPEVIFRGVPFMDEADDMIEDLRDRIERTVTDQAKKNTDGSGVDEVELRQKLHDDVARFVYERTKRRPMVLPVVVEV